MKIAVVFIILACLAIIGAMIGVIRFFDRYDPWQ